MRKQSRRKFPADFKAKVSLEALRSDRQLKVENEFLKKFQEISDVKTRATMVRHLVNKFDG